MSSEDKPYTITASSEAMMRIIEDMGLDKECYFCNESISEDNVGGILPIGSMGKAEAKTICNNSVCFLFYLSEDAATNIKEQKENKGDEL